MAKHKTVKIVRKSTTAVVPSQRNHRATQKFRVGGKVLPLQKPLNVKVAGERVMRKSVTLIPAPDREGCVLVRTGNRGRPAVLPVESIEKFRVL